MEGQLQVNKSNGKGVGGTMNTLSEDVVVLGIESPQVSHSGEKHEEEEERDKKKSKSFIHSLYRYTCTYKSTDNHHLQENTGKNTWKKYDTYLYRFLYFWFLITYSPAVV